MLIYFVFNFVFCKNDKFTLGIETDTLWSVGLKYMYRLEFDEAQKEFEKIKPGNPARDLALAGLKWWRYSQNFDDPTIDKPTFEKDFTLDARNAIDKCEKKLIEDPENPVYYFITGTAYGLMGRWHGLERNWWQAYKYGTKGRKYLKKALKLNPRIYDAYAGLGIFNYYADPDVLPIFLKLPALFLVKGNKEKGLKQLELAIKKGRFFSLETKIFLIEILTRYEHDYAQAIKIAGEIKNTDPENPFFCLIKIVTLLKADQWLETIEETEKFLKMHENTTHKGIAHQMAVVYLVLGDAYIMENRFALGLDALNKCIHETKFPAKAWVTLCYLRRAQIYDLLGERKKALADYKTAFDRPDMWNSKKYAEKGSSRPYELDEITKQILAE